MNRNHLTFGFILIAATLMLTIRSVLSASSGPADYPVYLPLVRGLTSDATPAPTSDRQTPTPSTTPTPTNTQTLTLTPTPTPTSTSTPTSTPTNTITPTPTPTVIPTPIPGFWEEVGPGSASGGGISNSDGDSAYASLAIAPDGTLYAAWYDDSSGNWEIYIRAWNGSSWAEVGTGSASGGGISNNAGNSINPYLAITPDGNPYVAWYDTSSGNYEVYVRAWDGDAWVEVGAGSASDGGISNNAGASAVSSFAIAPDGTPYVAWYDNSNGNYEIYVRAWDGNSWVEVGAGSASGGGISNNTGDSNWPSLAIAPDGMPYIAWHDDTDGNREIYILAWNGINWEEVGAGSATGGGISNNNGHSSVPSLAITPGETPSVAWYDNSNGNIEIYIRSWDGNTWAEVGVGSATGGGISNNSGSSFVPSLAISPGGMPYVAWHDNSSGNFEIYARTWNGNNWVELGVGSASGGGISNNAGASNWASLVVDSDSTPYVAWYDDSSGNFEIYVRTWNEISWTEVGSSGKDGTIKVREWDN